MQPGRGRGGPHVGRHLLRLPAAAAAHLQEPLLHARRQRTRDPKQIISKVRIYIHIFYLLFLSYMFFNFQVFILFVLYMS